MHVHRVDQRGKKDLKYALGRVNLTSLMKGSVFRLDFYVRLDNLTSLMKENVKAEVERIEIEISALGIQTGPFAAH